MAVGQNLMGTFWEDYHLLKGFLGSWGVRGFDPLPHQFHVHIWGLPLAAVDEFSARVVGCCLDTETNAASTLANEVKA